VILHVMYTWINRRTGLWLGAGKFACSLLVGRLSNLGLRRLQRYLLMMVGMNFCHFGKPRSCMGALVF
jgi:hypothetical protein